MRIKVTDWHRTMFRRLVVYTIICFVGLSLYKEFQRDQRKIRRKAVQAGYIHQEHGFNDDDDMEDHFTIYRKDTNRMVTMALRYHPPAEARTFHVGRRFRVSLTLAKSIAASFQSFFRLEEETLDNFVFLTAMSDDHFEEGMDAIASVQYYFPGKTIIYYDLGLSSKHIKEIGSWCDVEYRYFNFSYYPPHVKTLKKYTWKALLMQEVARDYGAFFWFDASSRLKSGDFTNLFNMALDNGGIAHIKTAPHSNYAATYKKTYEFITTNEEKQKEVQQVTSGAILFYNTEKMFYNVLWWWVLCALDPYCTAPIPWVPCDFKQYDRWKEYGHCHRYDQSVINLLASNLYAFNNSRYVTSLDISFQRWPTHYHKLKKCTDSGKKE